MDVPLAGDRKAQLLSVATARFVADGYAATSVASIVRAAGVSQGTFYNYFDSKQALLAELRRGVFKRYAIALSTSADPALAPDEALVRTVARILAALRDNLPLERVFREAESARDTQRAALQGRARLSALAAARIDAGIASGVFATDDPALASRFIITLFDNVLDESLVYEDPGRADAVAAAALRFSLAGLGVPLARARALAASLEST
ncbi:MAG: TetR/AcrR family transcriptional regulator [Myxococcota bacterium]|nr:TetR/AcrR family transcriptional regulator [Myxococcota bacterium]